MINCFFIGLLLSIAFVSIVDSLDCEIPKGCQLEVIENSLVKDEFVYANNPTVWCEFNDDFYEFKFEEKMENNTRQHCYDTDKKYSTYVFRFTSTNEIPILEKRFNLSNVKRYLSYYKSSFVFLYTYLMDIKGFDVNILDNNVITKRFYYDWKVLLANCRLDFYHEKKKINSCQDIINLNLTRIESIFQIKSDSMLKKLELNYVEYKQSICPFLFNNTNINSFYIRGFIDTFYKKSVLSFSNESFTALNSRISKLILNRINNIKIDLNILHPSVFYFTSEIEIMAGSLKSINGEIFRHLIYLSYIKINFKIFKKINHKQGIEWIRQINYGLNVNLSNFTDVAVKKLKTKTIFLEKYDDYLNEGWRIFPDKDFCMYIDFPFNQLVIIYNNYNGEKLTCTYLYLVKFYELYDKYIFERSEYYKRFIKEILNTTYFKSISNCNFEQRINFCNKSNYKIKDIWDKSDFSILNKKFQIAFKIHTYLWMNSLFCMIVLVIELLSWMTECFYPFEVFCPEIRKIVAIQFFKIIFKECFVTMLRFMLNFTYIAFALNRISLIGREHGKIVTFMSELGVKKYIGVSVFISCIFSWIKGFKYKVNQFYSHLNFPMSTEMSVISIMAYSSIFDDFYFTYNLISDLVNYLVFVVISIIIDICMVVQLRRTLDEKTKKSESMNTNLKQAEKKKTENEEVVNKAIKMVILNSAIGILFKLPVFFIPLLNMCAQFYNKPNKHNFSRWYNSSFNYFYFIFTESEFYSLVQDLSYLFFTFSLAIQLFIYNRFDKKFQTGFDRFKDKLFLKIKNIFLKSNTSLKSS